MNFSLRMLFVGDPLGPEVKQSIFPRRVVVETAMRARRSEALFDAASVLRHRIRELSEAIFPLQRRLHRLETGDL
jgi:hypothetical protein